MKKIKRFIFELVNFRKNAMKIAEIDEIIGHLQPLGKIKQIQDIIGK